MFQTMAPAVIYLSTTPSQVSTIGVDAQITEDNKLEIEVNGKSSQVTIPSSGGKWVQLDKSSLPTFNVGDIVLILTNIFYSFAQSWSSGDIYTVPILAVLDNDKRARYQPIHVLLSDSSFAFTTVEIKSVDDLNLRKEIMIVNGILFSTSYGITKGNDITLTASDTRIKAIYRFE